MLKWALPILILTRLCLAQGSDLVPHNIDFSSSHAVQAPPFSYFGESQCDRSGNMYFHTGDYDFRHGQILRLSSDGSSGSLFRITGKFANPDMVGFDNFWISADGEVFILSSGAEEKYVFTFDHDGTAKDPVALNVGKDVQLTDLAVFDNGFLFVWGYHDQNSPKTLRGKRYAAVLTDSGELVRELSIPMPDVDLGNLGALSDGAVASYAGNLYLLGSDQIAVVSVTGQIIRTLKYRKPDPQAIATKLYLSGGMAVIALSKISSEAATKGEVQRSYLSLDLGSDEPIAYYKVNGESAWDVCFSRSDGLTFLQTDGKTQKLATGLLR